MSDFRGIAPAGSNVPVCRNCEHSRDYHPGFLCHEDGCRCPGWVEKAAGTT